MTGRAAFGDFATAVARHLNQLPPPRSTRRQMTQPVVNVHQTTRGVRAIVHVMTRYADDIDAVVGALPDQDRRRLTPWVYAARRTREELTSAAAALQISSPDDAAVRLNLAPGEPAGPLDAAAATMLLGRDLLHTHLQSRPGGGTQRTVGMGSRSHLDPRHPRRAALPRRVGLADRAPLQPAAVTGQQGTTAQRRRLSTAGQCLSTLARAVDAAHEQQPVRASDLLLLHAIPVNKLARPHRPAGDEHIGDLCAGHHQHRRTRPRSRPPLRRPGGLVTGPDQGVLAAHRGLQHRHLLELPPHPANPRRPPRNRPDREGRHQDRRRARHADHARAAWLRAAEAWDTITTDTRGRISRTARDTASLALWTGRLAYADPDWTPELGPSHTTRQPGQLLADPQNLADIVDAVHHASHATARLASDTVTQLHTAAATGRLLVPTRSLPAQFDVPYRFAPAPRPCSQHLLDAYAAAAAASEQATEAIAQVAAAIKAPSRVLSHAPRSRTSQARRALHREPARPRRPGAAAPCYLRARPRRAHAPGSRRH